METITLPQSGISVAVPTLRYEMTVPDSVQPFDGVPPDIPVRRQMHDCWNKKDRQLETALNLARSR